MCRGNKRRLESTYVDFVRLGEIEHYHLENHDIPSMYSLVAARA